MTNDKGLYLLFTSNSIDKFMLIFLQKPVAPIPVLQQEPFNVMIQTLVTHVSASLGLLVTDVK